MSFDEALSENRVPPRVGDLRLRSEPGRLIGETSRSQRPLPWLPLLLRGAAVGLGLMAVARLLSGGSWLPALLQTVLAGLGLLAASRLDARGARRRFVLHFATELLRLESLPPGGGVPQLDEIPFDAVRSVDIVEELGVGMAIRLYWREGDAERTSLLLRAARPSEGESLHRVWRMLRNAFGLDGTSLPGDGGHVI